jgi:DNA-binding transcriptional ArsR family regulator
VTVILRFGAQDLLRCRFALSPLHETMGAVRTLTKPERQAYHLPWLRRVRSNLERLDLAPLLVLISGASYSPDFLSPPPDGPLTEIHDELTKVQATPAEQVHLELARSLAERYGNTPPPQAAALLADPAAARDRLADLFGRCWRTLVEPWWPRLRDLLEADIVFRARRLADGGMAALFADLHPRVGWQADALHVRISARADRALAGEGLLLLPSAFEWPAVGVMLDPPWQPTLIYPARGVAELWQPSSPEPSALPQLLGRTRAKLLLALAEPASTTGLARRCDLPVSTVSEHLSVLRAAGLVVTRRTGRQLLHEQTALGIALAAGR